MLVENQKVEVRWSYNNREWYEGKGYNFTKIRDTFLVKAEDAHPNSRSTKIKVKCDYCGKERLIAPQDYYKNTKNGDVKYSCGSSGCSSKKIREYDIERKEQQIQKFYEFCDKNGYTPISTIDDYDTAHNKLCFICQKHGIKKISLNSIQNGSICNDCSKEKGRIKRRLSHDEVKKRIESVNNNKLLNVDEYVNNLTVNLKILCGTCKTRIYKTSLDRYIRENNIRCKYCARSQSNNERIVQYFLDKNNIEYIYNKRFKECKDKRTLPFDFYLPDYNICIEFDGIQHFKPEFGEKSFVSTVLHDGMKNNYCKWNNIKLIRIPYWEKDNVEIILTKELNLKPIKNTKIKYIPNKKLLNN